MAGIGPQSDGPVKNGSAKNGSAKNGSVKALLQHSFSKVLAYPSDVHHCSKACELLQANPSYNME
jgi:hypothetical protein